MSLEDISTAFTEDKLKEILKKEGNYHLKGYYFEGGFKKGDSYLSEVFKLRVVSENSTGESKSLSFVVKTLPKNLGRRKTFRSTDFFRNEIYFYEKVIPAFDDFQSRRSPQKPFKKCPKCFASFCDGDRDYLALDDLSKYGFGAADRQEGLDFEHCRLTMEAMGRFHAVSLAMKDQEPEKFTEISEKIKETYYAPCFKDWYKDILESEILIARDAVGKEYPGTEIEEKMLKFTGDDLYDVLCGITHAKTPLSVISHGDCWAPNFLVKYNKVAGRRVPKEVKIIDFQLTRCASLALDLSLFLYSCTTQSLRQQHYDELLKIYHTSCCQLIQELGSKADIFLYSALKQEMRQFARFGVGMGIETLPFSLLPETDAFDLDSIEGDHEVPLRDIWVLKPIPTKEGRLRIADMFKHAIERGYLD